MDIIKINIVVLNIFENLYGNDALNFCRTSKQILKVFKENERKLKQKYQRPITIETPNIIWKYTVLPNGEKHGLCQEFAIMNRKLIERWSNYPSEMIFFTKDLYKEVLYDNGLKNGIEIVRGNYGEICKEITYEKGNIIKTDIFKQKRRVYSDNKRIEKVKKGIRIYDENNSLIQSIDYKKNHCVVCTRYYDEKITSITKKLYGMILSYDAYDSKGKHIGTLDSVSYIY